MSHYLVTGGLGFIGSHLVDYLVSAGHTVRILDNLSTGKRENLNSGAELVVGDVCDPDLVNDVCADVDGIFHLAAVASVEKSVRDWAGSHAVNQGATVNLFEAASRRSGRSRPKVVYASSAAVYGDNAIVPLAETCMPSPITPYGADKLGCEHHARAACLIHGVPSVGGRFFNVYGTRQDPTSPYSGVISIFLDRLTRGEPVTFFGDGGQVRDFIFVGDVVRWLVTAMADYRPAAQIFNVCTGRQTSVRTLAETIAAILGCPLDVIMEPSRPGDIRQSLGDPSLARRVLGFKAETNLGLGLQSILERPFITKDLTARACQ